MIDQAVHLAQQDFAKRQERWKHWSFVYQRGLVEWGVNREGIPSGLARMGYRADRHSMHAEALAFNKAVGLMDRRKPWSMVNVRLGPDRTLRMARPCPVCEAYMRSCGCREILYSLQDGGFGRLVL